MLRDSQNKMFLCSKLPYKKRGQIRGYLYTILVPYYTRQIIIYSL